MKTRLLAAFLVLFAAAAVIPSVAQAQTVDLGASANPSSKVKTVPVQKLSNRVEKLMRVVEGSTLPCNTRNLVLERLRVLDDALLSGRRSAARALVEAWRQEAWSMEAARVIGPELGGALQTQLSGLPDEIGYGWSDKPGPTRHWKPLAACGSGATGVGATSAQVVGSYNPEIATDLSGSIRAVLQMIVGSVPDIGPALFGITELLWPEGSDESSNGFKELVDTNTYNMVSSYLAGIEDLINKPGNWADQMATWQADCKSTPSDCAAGADALWGTWSKDLPTFTTDERFFQVSGQEVALLPLYTQFENTYLSFLRDGVMLHDKYWKYSSDPSVDPYFLARTEMDTELTPNNNQWGISYVNYWYQQGLDNEPAASASGWAARNAYIREMTLEVLDFRDTWKYLDPEAYPNGVPGGVKLTRIIYSDPVGTLHATPHFPSNISGPLKETSAYTLSIKQPLGQPSILFIDAAQATSPPLMGPAQSGPVTGDTSQPVNHANYYNLSALGPISEVKAESVDHVGYFPNWIQFGFASGAQYSTGSYVSAEGGVAVNACDTDLVAPQNCVATFQYPDEVLATVQANSEWDGEADAVVFAFRNADSFDPAGQVIGVDSGLCLSVPSWTKGTQVELSSCGQPATPAQIWTYDPGLQQISVTHPAEWNENQTTDSGKYCLGTAGGATAAYTQVVIKACDDGAVTYDASGNPIVSSQRWSIEAVGSGIGKITNVKSGLVLDVYDDGGTQRLQLNSYNGSDWQQWHVHDPLTGEIHGIGSGRCVDVPGAGITPGTQVQLFDCNGGGAQQWTYNPATQELIYAKDTVLCLEARGGGTTEGTAVQINTCTDNPEQRWTLQGISQRTGATVSGGIGLITNVKSGFVLDAQGGNTANGTLLRLWHNNGTEAQSWSRTSSQGGPVHAVGAGKCLTETGSDMVVIQTCADPMSAQQTWVYHPVAQTFTIGGKCLSEMGGGTTTSGMAANVAICTGASFQRWIRDPHYSIITNVASGLVLDVAGGGTADGTTVILSTLPMTTDKVPLPAPRIDQKWVWSLN